MNVDRPVLVLGSTGGQGSAVVSAMLSRGVAVRGLVRNLQSASAQRLAARDVEVVGGDLGDRESLASAMRGVAGVFAMTTPFESGPAAEIAQGRAILTAAHEARVPHLVFSSVAGADQDTGVPHFETKGAIERELAAGDVPYTILGPTYFFDNALGDVDRIRKGALDLPLPPDRPLQQLARPDLGEFTADVFAAPDTFIGQRIELAGDAPTPDDMAATLSTTLGRTVRHNEVQLDEIGNDDMRAMWTFLRGHGYRVDLPALHAAHPDLRWTSFADWAESAFSPAP
ncbi:NmrA/HSCARG family protein [Streptomyces sp. NBC_01003]|uniref:NmrA/HSCARG family protein n=1 Tax=Streptomyces sp. NBC_01003 TaxID=2903714 RepID=UPI003870E630|nr:NmrA/HSCARG family protein [Streptomyces sp. NBC_01003]